MVYQFRMLRQKYGVNRKQILEPHLCIKCHFRVETDLYPKVEVESCNEYGYHIDLARSKEGRSVNLDYISKEDNTIKRAVINC